MTEEQNQNTDIPPQQQRISMSFAIAAAMAGVAGMACLGGNVITLAAIKLGANELYLGLLIFAATIPLISSLFTISAVEKKGKRRVMLIWYSVSLLFAAMFILLPLTAERWPSQLSMIFLLTVVFLLSTSNALGNTGWFPILQDIVPAQITGSFFAKLRISWQSTWLTTTLVMAYFFRNAEPPWWKFKLIFIVGLVFLPTRVLTIIPIAEIPSLSRKTKLSIIKRFVNLWRNRHLRMLAWYISFYMIAATIAEPFKIKLLKDLGYSYGFIIATTASIGLGAIISLKFWGNLADRFGNRPIFSISHVGMIIASMLWIAVEKNTFSSVFIFFIYFIWSFFNSGNGIAQTRYMLHAVPAHRQYFLNIILTITYSATALGPLLGGLFLRNSTNLTFQSGAVSLNNYHILFILSSVLFVIPHILRKKLQIKKDTPTSRVLADITRPLKNVFVPFVKVSKKARRSNS